MSDSDQSDYTRTIGQVRLKLFILQFSIAVAAGHLGSLRKLSGDNHVWLVVRSIICPFSPFLELIFDLVLVICDRKQRPCHGALYFLNCIVGAPAVDPSNVHVSLIQVRKRDGWVRAKFEWERYTWKWLGRFVLLIGFTIQLSFTFFLVCRRMHAVGISAFPLDIHSFACCIGGFGIAFSSIAIHVCPIRWGMENDSSFEDDWERYMLCGLASGLSAWMEMSWPTGTKDLWESLSLLAATFCTIVVLLFGVLFFNSEKVGRGRWAESMFGSLVSSLWLFSMGFLISGTVVSFLAFVGGVTYNPTGWSWSDPLSDTFWVF
jgi:hypothetical protein